MVNMDNAELINRCITRDPAAWSLFVDRYSGLVFWAIKNRLKNWDYLYQPEDIEEIHQNIFLDLWKRNALTQVKDQKKIQGWLVIVSGNEAVDYFKRRKAQFQPKAVSIFQEFVHENGTTTIADILPSGEDSPFQKTKLAEIENILEEELNRLPAEEKTILKLSVLYNKTYRQIAEILDMPTGSVSTALRNIKNKLKKRLKGKI